MKKWTNLLGFAIVAWVRLSAQTGRDLSVQLDRVPDHKGTRWAVVIGISQYGHLPAAAQLHFADRDAEAFATFLRGTTGGALPGDHIRLLTGEKATLAELRAAVETWLVGSATPDDVVYFFFAGHGVLDDHDDGYFVAYDSDPQNLHATALSFAEVDQALSDRVRAKQVVLVADACHTGRLGWASYSPNLPSRAAGPLEKIGHGDRSVLKLLAASPSEQSFEDAQWGGGHGVFTYVLLDGLRGQAKRGADRTVVAAEAIDYISRRVPQDTGNRQHPRVAGTFDGQLPLAFDLPLAAPAVNTVSLDVSGPANSGIYIDDEFRGSIRPSGVLHIAALLPGRHSFSADFADGATLDGTIALGDRPARVAVTSPAMTPLGQLRSRIKAGRVLEPGGAWEFYRSQRFPAADQAAATAAIGAALEGLGQACVNDYVQSTALGPKTTMLEGAADAYDRLRILRPNDRGLETRATFCRARALIAEERIAEARVALEKALQLDPRFACTYNALGVVYTRIHKTKEAREAFDTAAKLAPEWGLPQFQIASQYIAAGDLSKARPYLEKAVAYNPRSVTMRWNLVHVDRLLGHVAEVRREAGELIQRSPGYAPTYIELGLAEEASGNRQAAAKAFASYLELAPNFADSNEVRRHLEQLR